MRASSLIKSDLFRYAKSTSTKDLVKFLFKSRNFRYTYFFRIVSNEKKYSFAGIIARFFYKRLTTKLGFQIPKSVKVSRGLLLVHFGNIIINSRAVLGSNCTIYPGVTIGMDFRGQRKGDPVIGNNVWIGSNAIIVGKITIGDNVLIAPNSFVNLSVPSNSIVFGNPAIIKHRADATEGYIINAFNTQET